MRMDGRIALVTGASKGLGQAIAVALADDGAHIVINGRDVQGMEQTAALVRAAGRQALLTPADIRDPVQVRRVVDQALTTFGKIDILVNNAGGALFTPIAFEQLSEADWDLVVDTNLKAVFLCCQSVIPQMRQQQYGRIVHIASIAGRTTSGGMAGAHYVSAKAGLCGFSRQLASEYGKDNITSNVVAPGLILSTERVRALWASRPDDVRRQFLESIPLGRPGVPEDVAAAVAFLASDQASYITGATLDVNGGRFMG